MGMLIGGLLEAIGIGAIYPLIGFLNNPEKIYQNKFILELIIANNLQNYKMIFISMSLALSIYFLLKNLYQAVLIYFQTYFVSIIQKKFAIKITEAYVYKPYIFFKNHNSAEIIRNITVSIPNVAMMILHLMYMFTEVFIVLFIILLLLFVDYFTSFAMIILLGFVVAIFILCVKKCLLDIGIKQQIYAQENIKWLNQIINAIKEIKVLSREEFFLSKFAETYNRYNYINFLYSYINQTPKMLIELSVILGLLGLIAFKVFFDEPYGEIVSSMGLLTFAAFRLMPSANRIIGYNNSMRYYYPAFLDLYNLLKENEQEIMKNIVRMKENIYIESLNYKYPDSNIDILSNINVNIRKGEFIGIVGQSGSGKSTFIDVFLGLLIGEHRIYVDGILFDVNKNKLKIGYVPQNIIMLDDSIAANIAIGMAWEDINEKRLKEVINMSGLADYVYNLPNQEKTIVGENGARLSGGQKQRIGIARALYIEPEILIMDEATSSLDENTEKIIMDALISLKGSLTILSVTHRLSTLKYYDQILELHDGNFNMK